MEPAGSIFGRLLFCLMCLRAPIPKMEAQRPDWKNLAAIYVQAQSATRYLDCAALSPRDASRRARYDKGGTLAVKMTELRLVCPGSSWLVSCRLGYLAAVLLSKTNQQPLSTNYYLTLCLRPEDCVEIQVRLWHYEVASMQRCYI